MEKSQFSEIIAKWFGGIALLLTKTINGKEAEEMYLYKSMLTKKFSATLTWETLNVDGRSVMADVVALDANFPLKKRSAIRRAMGDIPKLGTKRSLNETQMTEIMVLEAMPGDNSKEITQIIFDDTKAVTKGVWERLEFMFLQGLSNDGVYFTGANNNVGVEIQIDLKQPDKNKFGVNVAWSDDTAKPLDDINNVVKKAKTYGHNLAYLMMNDATFTQLLENTQIRRLYAAGAGYGTIADASLPTILPEQLRAVMKTQYKLSIVVIDRAFVFERNGVDTILQGWVDNKVVFSPSLNVGSLVYGKLAAELRPKKSADYAKVDDYILLTKYQKGDDTPLEFTTSQARVLPVINMYNIYSMDVEEADAAPGVTQTEGDEFITLFEETDVLRVNVINALNALGVAATESNKDTTLIKRVNELSDEDVVTFKEAIEMPTVDAGADTTSSAATKSITGTATASGDKTIVSTVWSKVSGPAGGAIATPNALTTNLTGLVTGTYVYKLTATDSEGTISSDTISIVVTIP